MARIWHELAAVFLFSLLFYFFNSFISPHVHIMSMERDALLWAIVYLALRDVLQQKKLKSKAGDQRCMRRDRADFKTINAKCSTELDTSEKSSKFEALGFDLSVF